MLKILAFSPKSSECIACANAVKRFNFRIRWNIIINKKELAKNFEWKWAKWKRHTVYVIESNEAQQSFANIQLFNSIANIHSIHLDLIECVENLLNMQY